MSSDLLESVGNENGNITTEKTTSGSSNRLEEGSNEPERLTVAHLELMEGWKLWISITCLFSGLLLSALETTIIATALVSISSSLGGYDKANWVVTAYLLTYTGFLVVFSRISDLFGRKGTLVASFSLFTLFSLACGVSQTMEQLIIFRAFQGVGGAGLYSLAMAVMTEITPIRLVGVVAGLMGSIFALSSLLGPVLGGVITTNTTWRWVFLLNLPPGTLACILVIWVFPRNAGDLPTTWKTVRGLDFLGITTSLAGCIMLIFALESGGTFYRWNSATIIVSFVVAGSCLLAFAIWQTILSKHALSKKILPLFPAHLVTQRTIGFTMLTAFLTGFPFMMTIIFLPQRLQLQNGMTPERAGVNMLPLLLLSATGAALCGMISVRRNISWYLLAGAIGLQMLGLGLMSSLPATAGPIASAQYGYQVILGLGFGLSLGSLAIIARVEVEERDISIVMGAVTQVRVLGGVIGIAIGQAIISSRLNSELATLLGPERLAELLHSTAVIRSFPPEVAAQVMGTYGRAFALQNRIMIGMAGAALLACLGAWKRHFESAVELERKRVEAKERRLAALQDSRTTSDQGSGTLEERGEEEEEAREQHH